ncbi:MAG: hypothetical protein ACXAC5_02505 [Promethearchaeota archaeon]|jgi:hypothetical protein
MNWLQRAFKFGRLASDNSFFLLDNDLVFFSSLHSQYLTRTFGLSMTEADALRFLLPRGRATQQYTGVLIEASAELQPYQREIANRLELEPIDRPKWDFNDSHYQISVDLAQEQLRRPTALGGFGWSFSPAAERFLSRYAPSLLELA